MSSPRHHPSEPDFVPVSTAHLLPLHRVGCSSGGATVVRYRRARTRPRHHPDPTPPSHREAS